MTTVTDSPATDQPGNVEQSSKSEMNNLNSMIDAEKKSNKASIIPSCVLLDIIRIFAASPPPQKSPEMYLARQHDHFLPANSS